MIAGSALVLTVARGGGDPSQAARSALVRLVGLGILIQGAHFIEELVSGFHLRFPELLGLAPWPVAFFVPFNLGWLAVWVLSALSLRALPRVALFPIWLLAIACAVNCVAHPLMAAAVGGYFPGLWTSPVCGVMGVVLLRRLGSYTAAAPALGAMA